MTRQLIDSGCPWLGDIPEDWRLAPLGRVFRERNSTVSEEDFEPLSVSMAGVVPRMENVALTASGDNRKLVRAGDYVINSRSDRKGSGGLSPTDGSVSIISTVLRPVGIEPRFSHHLLRSTAFQEEFYRWGSGIVADLWSTRYDKMSKITLPLPPPPEQQAIADYLDRETAKIDALIEKQATLIDRLRERRSQLRSHLVMARSFQDRAGTGYWFGSVPSNWETPRLSHIASVVLGRMINAATVGEDDVQLPYVAAGSIQPDELVLDDSRVLSVPLHEVRKYELHAGDVMVVEGGAGYGRSHVLREDLPGWVFQNHVARVRARSDHVDTRYVREVLEMCRLAGFFEANNRTATLPSLSRDVLGALRIPCPPLSEQKEIADHLDRETAKIDALITKAERFIELARERRSALITSAVTGQFDVTEGAA